VPTARFDDVPEVFSVVLRFSAPAPPDGPAVHECELNLLAPDRLPDLAALLTPGRHLTVMEGARVVADCDVLSVRTEERGPPFATE
jgi:hypothetical protein